MTVISGFTIAALLIQTSFQSWADSPIKTTVERLPISKIKFPKVTVCPPRGTFTDLNYDLMLAENTTFEEEQAKKLHSFINDVVDNHVYMDKWTKLNEDNKFFNWYHGYTKFDPPENHPFFGFDHNVDSSALSGVVTTEYFGDEFQKDMIEKHVYYVVNVVPPKNLINENMTLHLKVEMVRIAGYDGEKMFQPGFNELKQNKAYFTVSPPVNQTFQFKRNIKLEELSKVKMEKMPGFKISWHYTSSNGVEYENEKINNISRRLPKENQELVK